MEKFSLEKWLQDKSRKISTRDGRSVRIICWDKKDSEYPIVGLVSNENGLKEKEGCCSFTINGKAWGEDCYDLFFADEEEELTEFEKAVENILNYPHFQDEQAVKQISKTLLDLARKEILKDLPKWEKSTLPIPDEEYPTGFNGKYFCYKGYCVDYKKLFETLPKEE